MRRLVRYRNELPWYSFPGRVNVNPEPLEAVLLALQTGAILLIGFKTDGSGKLIGAHDSAPLPPAGWTSDIDSL